MRIKISQFLLDAYSFNLSDVNSEYADNEWVKDPAVDDACIEDTYDESFRDDVNQRVKQKYMKYEFFTKIYNDNGSYEDSLEYVKSYIDSSSTKRIPVLGATEYLGPFIANSILHSKQKINEPAPFIVYAPLKWSIGDNIHVVSCFATGLKTKIYDKIVILLPLTADAMVPKGNPRITIFEIYHMYKILGDFVVDVSKDKEKFTLTVLASQFYGGKKLFRRSKSHKNKNIKKRKAGKTRKQTYRRG